MRIIGSISACLTAAGLAWAGGTVPGQPAVHETIPAVAGDAPGRLTPQALTTQAPAQGTGEPLGQPQSSTPSGDAAPMQQGDISTPPPTDLKDYHDGPCNTMWANADYLFWYTKNGPLTVPLLAGPGGVIFGGNSSIDYGSRSGGRVNVGVWLDEKHVFGWEAGGFMLERPTITNSATSDAAGSPALSRPVLNSLTGQNVTFAVSMPGVLSGGLSITSASRFWGLETNFVRNLFFGQHFDMDLYFGARFLDLDENLSIVQNSTLIAPGAFLSFPGILAGTGSSFTLTDNFSTRNQFIGGQMGMNFGWRYGIWSVDVESKVALGPVHQAISIMGGSVVNIAGDGTASYPGGLLALSGTNIGHTSTNWFTIVPEVGMTLGLQVTKNIRAQVGGTFLYINNVLRPASQVNNHVDPSFVPAAGGRGVIGGMHQPQPLMREDDFWAAGANAGITIQY
jgi:hypothetical protein